MSRPSRHLEALQILRAHYRQSGVLPTLEVLAAKMGYRSTSSAYHTIQPLLREGLVLQDGRRLVPGRGFKSKTANKRYPVLGAASISEFLDTNAQDTAVIEITNSSLEGEGILKGDFLLISNSAEPSPGHLLLIQTKHSFRLASYEDASPRRRRSGVVLAQFRKYRP